MAGDVTVGALQRLSYMPGLPNKDGGQLIAGQDYFNVFFTGGTISNVTLTNVSITGFTITAPLILGTQAFTDTGTLAQFTGNANSYEQFILQNTNAGNAASADFIVCANNATANTHYGDFGINSSTFAGAGSLNLANATYLYANGGDLVLGIASVTAASIHFVVNNSTSDAMIITAAAQVGINTASPQAGVALDLSGNTLANNSSVVLPKGTTANRPTVGIEGMMRYNTDLFKVEAFFGGAWVSLGSGGGGGTPGGSPGSIQWNSAGTFAGFTMSGDATLVTSTGVITVTQSAGAFNAIGAFSVATNKFTVASATGNTAVAGTLGVTSDFSINTNKFTVTAASGNTLVAGTLSATGNFAVNTNKFTVDSATGNTVVAGTLAVTSTITSAAHTITSASANSLAVGPNGTTTPIFNVDSSTVSAVAGLTIQGAATGGTVNVTTTDSGANTSLNIQSKGTGTLTINSPSGVVNLSVGGTSVIQATSAGSILVGATATINFGGNNQIKSTGFGALSFGNTSSNGFSISGSTIQIGPGDSTNPSTATLKNSDINFITNTSSGNFTMQGGAGTGTGSGGSLIFQTAPAGTTGSTKNTYVTALTIASSGIATFAQPIVATTTTQAAGNNSTSLASTAYIDRGISGASMVLLSSVAANGAASVVFSSAVITATYDDYMIVCDGVLPGTGTVNFFALFSANNGGSYFAASYDCPGFAAGTGGSGASSTSGAANLDLLSGQTVVTTATQPSSGTIMLRGVNTTTGYVQLYADMITANGGTSFGRAITAGRYSGAAGAINNIKLLMSSGTITGNFYLYGLRKV